MSFRKDKLADLIRDLLASSFQGGRLSDPRLEQVTITAVKLSPDMQLASVYFRVYDDAMKIQAYDGLKLATSRLRRELSGLRLRRIPNLRFFYDESLETASQIESLLSQV